jgi:dihydroorotate dehydrogenase (fumarate)
MTDLSTTYMGLKLDNPLIVGSCGLTKNVDAVARCADAGAGAVVLKSIFEEQVAADLARLEDRSEGSLWHPEAAEYIRAYGKENAVATYLDTIGQAKRAVSIPVIASVHCVAAGEWTDFASRAEQAGADALELNMFVLPSDPRRDGAANEQVHLDVLAAVKARASIPVALKIGSYFSSLSRATAAIDAAGADGLVLFNRFFSPDFEIETMRLVPAPITSGPEEYVHTLRWVAILSGRLACDIAAATGIHDGATVVKMLLAGARAVQVASALYKHGTAHTGAMLDEVRDWMRRHDHASIDDFRGKLAAAASENPAAYDRVQFMKASVGIE